MTFESKHPVAQLIVDVAVSLALFVVACVLAGWLQTAVTPNLKWMYVFWFALGLLPCFLYMRYRAVANFDSWDIVAFSPMPLVLGLASTLLGHQYAILAIFAFAPVCLWIRHFLPARKPKQESRPDGVSASEPLPDNNAMNRSRGAGRL